jgi:hypothetical protein
MFDGYADLQKKLDYYRDPAHEAERMHIVRNAAAKAKAYHTYSHRANYFASVTWAALKRRCEVSSSPQSPWAYANGRAWGEDVSSGTNSRRRKSSGGRGDTCVLFRRGEASRGRGESGE